MLTRRQELRKRLRRPMRHAAEIVFHVRGPAVRCMICDISDSGARLAVAGPAAELPKTFTLVLVKEGRVRRNCEVVWTDARTAGVKFL